jgi:hypothetical protein
MIQATTGAARILAFTQDRAADVDATDLADRIASLERAILILAGVKEGRESDDDTEDAPATTQPTDHITHPARVGQGGLVTTSNRDDLPSNEQRFSGGNVTGMSQSVPPNSRKPESYSPGVAATDPMRLSSTSQQTDLGETYTGDTLARI